MAHASSREKCLLALKKARIAKLKKRQEWDKMDLDKKEEIKKLRNEPPKTKQVLLRLLWDYNKNQLNFGKIKMLKEVASKRLEELNNGDVEFFKDEKAKCEKILEGE
jgi:hypothetical protein